MRKSFRYVALIIISFVLLLSNILPTFAAEWNGSSADTSVGGSLSGSNGYGIKHYWATDEKGPNHILGLRFSLYNTDTGKTK